MSLFLFVIGTSLYAAAHVHITCRALSANAGRRGPSLALAPAIVRR